MKSLVMAGMLASAVLIAGAAAAAEIHYPVSNVRIYVPASPGGGTDTATRIFADYFQKHTDANIGVVNQAAGSGAVASQTVSTSPTDGSVLFMYHASMQVGFYSGKVPFSYEDFTPLATIAEQQDVYITGADAPYSSLSELIDYAKAHPNEVTVGSQLGGTTQVKGDALNKAADGTMRVVDAGTDADRLVALLGGQIDVTVQPVNSARQYVEDGKVKALGVLSNEPNPFVPEWPTAKSQGVDVAFPLVFTVYGPKNIDPAVTEAMNKLIDEMRNDADFKETLKKAGIVPSFRTADEAAEFVKTEAKFVKQFFVK